MEISTFKRILEVRETIAVEFKRCGNGITPDTYQSVCSFMNRFGGDLFLGVEDDGTVFGIPENAVSSTIKNFIKMVSNPEVIHPAVYLAPQVIEYEGKQIIHVHVPLSSEVHTCKKVVYDRVDDADVKVTTTSQLTLMCIRKQNLFTEKHVYPYATESDLRLDLMPRIRQMAVNRMPKHPWKEMSDSEILISAGLYSDDKETGKNGLNLAAIMLLGKDTVIKNVCSAYRTDALLRKVNLDRYDDRLIVETNLIDSYDLLMEFAAKHLWDKFYLEGDVRMSLRDTIAREVISNILIHREFTSSYITRLVIERDRMISENANRALTGGAITPDDFEPNPKNPIIAAFFRNIGLADERSGVRKLYRYVRRYSGQDPQLVDGDVFKIIVPLDDEYSFDVETSKAPNKAQTKHNQSTIKAPNKAQTKHKQSTNKAQSKHQTKHNQSTKQSTKQSTIKAPNKAQTKHERALIEKEVLEFFRTRLTATQADAMDALHVTRRGIQDTFASLKEKGLIRREGSKQNGRWIVEK